MIELAESGLPNVRYDPKATEMMRRSEWSLSAMSVISQCKKNSDLSRRPTTMNSAIDLPKR